MRNLHASRYRSVGVPFLGLAWLGLYFASVSHAQAVRLNGRVEDALGQNVPSVTVAVIPYQQSFYGPTPSTVTDKDGKFILNFAFSGRFQVIAYKKDAGYPNVYGLVFTSGKEHFPVFDTGNGQTFDNVSIILPPADGVISGLVRDAKSGESIPQARITVRWEEAPDVEYSSYLDKDGTFLFALPPRPITVEVTAKGYKPWHYVDEQTGKSYALLALGTKLNISINLEPIVSTLD